jgi:orotate phosphoribosyltransferase
MNEHKRQFIELAVNAKALQFGTFTLKSGRVSPYFFNAGAFCTGLQLHKLAHLYAETLLESGIACQNLFGPAYKGIPLATATAIALSQLNYPVNVTFNRKETKNHGEGGNLIGAGLGQDVVVIDDVISAGTAFRISQKQVEQAGGYISGLLIAFDRCEKGVGKQSAIQEIESQGIQVVSIVRLHDVLEYLQQHQQRENVQAIERYLAEYGA